jgi:hypothetical protein
MVDYIFICGRNAKNTAITGPGLLGDGYTRQR